MQNTTDLRSHKAAFNNGLSQWSSDGAGEKRNDFTIDGVANVAADRVAYSPPSAAVEEFKIQTATYDAAVGNAMGATVNVVTKSGTNNLRGQVYEWFRGSKFDASNYFFTRSAPPVSPSCPCATITPCSITSGSRSWRSRWWSRRSTGPLMR
ncbi:MAG: hypothetical protein ACRD15_18205 [Vicinamibacterales bacterium]